MESWEPQSDIYPSEHEFQDAWNRYGRLLYKAAERAGFHEPCSAMDLEDVVSIAKITLLLCMRRYDPNRGASFATYYFDALVNAIRKELSLLRAPVSIPQDAVYDKHHPAARISASSAVPFLPELLESTARVEGSGDLNPSLRRQLLEAFSTWETPESQCLMEAWRSGIWHIIHAYCATLPSATHRQVVLTYLYRYAEFGEGNYREVAEQCGVSPSTAVRVVRIALRALRARIKTFLETGEIVDEESARADLEVRGT